MVRLAIIAVVVCVVRVAIADPVPGPKWISGPDKAYNCTHYLDQPSGWEAPPRVNAGEPMKLVMRKDKVMQFTLAARATTKKGKVSFELETPPPGAKLAGAKFSWTVAGTSGQKFDFAVVAVGDDGGRTRWPLGVTIADDKLVTAWSAGFGSVWPDCTVFAPMQPDEVGDFDGDGKDDVIFRTYAGDDGTTETHVMLQRAKMKFVEVHTCYSCGPGPEVAVDGTRLLVDQQSCCCMETGTVYRFDGPARSYRKLARVEQGQLQPRAGSRRRHRVRSRCEEPHPGDRASPRARQGEALSLGHEDEELRDQAVVTRDDTRCDRDVDARA